VLSGDVIVRENRQNISIHTNETYTVKDNSTHRVYTVGDKPSCYMYVYLNTSMTNMTEDELIQSYPNVEQQVRKVREWNNKTLIEKASSFYSKKYYMYMDGLWQLYYAVSVILEIGPIESNNILNENDEL